MKDFICTSCGRTCELRKEWIHFAGTHCTHGKDGKHWTGWWISDCCGADYTDNITCEEDDARASTVVSMD